MSDRQLLVFGSVVTLFLTAAATYFVMLVVGPDSLLDDCGRSTSKCIGSHLEAVVPAFLTCAAALVMGVGTAILWWNEWPGPKEKPDADSR